MQRYLCTRCNKSFSDAKPLDGLRLDEAKIVQVVRCLTEGCGVRATARLVGCNKDTVVQVLRTIGQKCEEFHDKTIRNVKVESLQADELWARVFSRQDRRKAENQFKGDFYTFIGIDRRTKLIVSHLTDKRTQEATHSFVRDLASRVPGIVQITCDGWYPYVPAFRKYLLPRLNLAVMQKIYSVPADRLDSIDPIRRYSPPRCTGVKLEIRAGVLDVDRITTSHVERLNLSIRTFNRRFTRLCLGYSRKLDCHRYSVALFVVAYNFCKVHSTTGTTPAVGARLTNHVWTVEELVKILSNTI